MNRDELIERLKGYEWRDVEFKEAQFAVPKDVYETVSAFSNTEGGYIIFGIKQKRGGFEIVGVIPDCVDDVQNAFLNTIRSGNKISVLVPVRESMIQDEAGTVLVFLIPEANRREKPVHLNGKWEESYIRRGGCDQRCSEEEIRRFIRDAADKPYDAELLYDLDPEHCFDDEVLGWYRKLFAEKQPGRYETHSNIEFLNEWGLVVETQDALVPTMAGVLLFGRAKHVRQVLPRCVVDYQRIDANAEDWAPEERWHDREPIEENLIRAWWLLVEKFMRLADKPFNLNVATLRRDDQPPDYIAFREAAINLLIHQDFGDHRRTPSLKIFRDRTVFWNPGDAFATTSEMLDATAKEIRNPAIVGAFRRIGLSDQAGTGVRTIFKNWRDLGNFPPGIQIDKAGKTFELKLLRKALISEEQRVFLATLGVRLSEMEAQAFAFSCQEEQIDVTDVRAVTGTSVADARAILEKLKTQVLLTALDADEGIYVLAKHLRKRAPTLIPGKPEDAHGAKNAKFQKKAKERRGGKIKPLKELTTQQWKTVLFCDLPRSLSEVMEKLGVSHRGYFMRKTMQPLIGAELMKMTKPDKPRAADQKYVLTQQGVDLAAWRQQQDDRNRRKDG